MNTSNVIVGVVSNGNYNVVGTITQWDYGYIFRIEGVELPAVYRVDFATDRYYGEALTVYGNEDGAEIPEELIATGKDIYAFYYFIGDGYGKTAHTWRIQNDLRARISDKQPTPSQQDSIDQAIVRVNEAVETAEEAAQNAREDADFLRNASAEATTLPSRSEATAVYSEGVFSFGIPKGIDAITMDVQTEAILIHANSDGRLKANTIVEIKFKVYDGDTLVTPTAIDATTLEGTPPVAIRSTTNKVTYHLPYNKQMQYDNGSVTISATYGGKTITHVIPYAVIKVIVESLKHVKDDSSDNGGVIEGNVTANSAAGLYAHAEGRETTANASYAHAEGYLTTVSAMCGHAEGAGNTVSGDNAHAEGSGNTITASGLGAHAEGNNTTVSARWAHAEGGGTTVSGECAHAEGAGTRATGGQSHSEGGGTLASGAQSHAEGASTVASGDNSHAENLATTASGACSHASGVATIAQRKSQMVIGEYNVADTGGNNATTKGSYIFVAGNGISNSERSNAMTLDWSGNIVAQGKVTAGTHPSNPMDLATKQYVDGLTGGQIVINMVQVDNHTHPFVTDYTYQVIDGMVRVGTYPVIHYTDTLPDYPDPSYNGLYSYIGKVVNDGTSGHYFAKPAVHYSQGADRWMYGMDCITFFDDGFISAGDNFIEFATQ